MYGEHGGAKRLVSMVGAVGIAIVAVVAVVLVASNHSPALDLAPSLPPRCAIGLSRPCLFGLYRGLLLIVLLLDLVVIHTALWERGGWRVVSGGW